MNGVKFSEKTHLWRAWIRIQNQPIHLGYFPTQMEAGLARDAAAIKLGQLNSATLNYPEEYEDSLKRSKNLPLWQTGSRFKGVMFDFAGEQFFAVPTIAGKRLKKLSFPPTEEGERQAALAVDRIRRRIGCSVESTNFPSVWAGLNRSGQSKPEYLAPVSAEILPELAETALTPQVRVIDRTRAFFKKAFQKIAS